MISVVVVDDHAVFREGLRALLARVADISVVGEASTTDEAVAVSADAAAGCRADGPQPAGRWG